MWWLTLLHTAGTWPGRATKRNGGGRSGGTSGTATSGSDVRGGSRAGDQTFCRRLRRRRRTGTLTRGAQRLLGNYTQHATTQRHKQRTTNKGKQRLIECRSNSTKSNLYGKGDMYTSKSVKIYKQKIWVTKFLPIVSVSGDNGVLFFALTIAIWNIAKKKTLVM